MERDLLEILKDALETRQRKEELDRAVGRAVRRRNRDFNAYIEIMNEVRDLSNSEGIDRVDAARKLVGKTDQQGKEDQG